MTLVPIYINKILYEEEIIFNVEIVLTIIQLYVI